MDSKPTAAVIGVPAATTVTDNAKPVSEKQKSSSQDSLLVNGGLLNEGVTSAHSTPQRLVGSSVSLLSNSDSCNEKCKMNTVLSKSSIAVSNIPSKQTPTMTNSLPLHKPTAQHNVSNCTITILILCNKIVR